MIRISILAVCCLVAVSCLGVSTMAQEPAPQKPNTETAESMENPATDSGRDITINDTDGVLPKRPTPPFRQNRRLQSVMSTMEGVGNSQPTTSKPLGPDAGRKMRSSVGGKPNVQGNQSNPARNILDRNNAGLASPRPSSPSGPRVSYKNGIRTIKVKEGQRTIMIEEDPQSGITVEITKSYDPSKHGDLKRRLPELSEYVEMFPSEMDAHRIELNVNVVSTYSGRTLEELRAQNVSAYNIYRRYIKSVGAYQGSSQTGGGNKNTATIE